MKARVIAAAIAACLGVLLLPQHVHADPLVNRSQVISEVSSTTDGNIVVFSGPGGKRVKDGGSVASVGGVPSSRTLTATSPILIDGTTSADFSANRTVSIQAASGSANGYLSSANYTLIQTAVQNSRLINTTTPIGGGGALSGDLTLTCTTCVTTSRTITTTSPITGGGDLSANRTIAITAADATHDGYLAQADYTKIQNAVQNTLTLTATGPISGGGALSANRSFSCPTCAIGSGTSVATAIPKYSGTDGLTLTPSNVLIDSSDRVSGPFGNSTFSLSLASSGATAVTLTGASSNAYLFNVATSGAGLIMQSNVASSAVPAMIIRHGNNMAATNVVQIIASITGTANQTSTAGYKALHVNLTETGLGSGVHELASLEVAGAQMMAVDDHGTIGLQGTLTAGGTTGAQTINKPFGTVNFAAAATTLVVTDSVITTSTPVICTVQTNDTTAKSCGAVPAAGSVTLFLNAAATAETKVAFQVLRQL